MKPENKQLLIAGAAELGVQLSEFQAGLVDAYLSHLDKWAAKMNLTAVKGERERVVKLVLDSLALAPLLDQGMRVADVGSGAGLPGLPVKIARPDLYMTLIESRRKRADFLGEVERRLGLQGLTVFAGRAEEYKDAPFDAALVRAVGRLGELALPCRKLVKQGGLVLAMKGPAPEKEIAEDDAQIQKTGFRIKELKHYRLPDGAGGRSIVVMEKTRSR
ncbi:MAG TPA: 16S rRNA (guanine(527)-N(7))-methyltransferase RsmG [bacterium]|nr:16S rRNA (guanine(527)-N(7))-methyltransferase RsmG [bacterium]